ncbi:MAG: phosphatase PAP2 family protein [Chitinophagales bacterium]|nr:phosphatase PAP2 family protein [Chitinophagales bacterium]
MTLHELDYSLFKLVNQQLANIVLDILCPVAREKLIWFPIYALIAFFLYKRYRNRAIWIGAMAILTILLSDQISASLVKPYFHRLRPCNNPEIKYQVRLLVDSCGSGYSFVSSHATNHFALAVFLSFVTIERKKWMPVLFIWAIFVSFSQVYVGLHFPGDVAAGALLGTLIGLLTGYSTYRMINH